MTPDPPDQGTKCEWCGADYDPVDRPPAPVHAQPSPTEATAPEPATRCEWCGAEYPVPEAPPGS